MKNDDYALPIPESRAEYLYLYGGRNSIDKGVPDWGANNEHDAILVGDKAGDIVLVYENGNKQVIPLIFGYTMWWHERWNDASAPFKGAGSDEKSESLLRETLHLRNGFEGVFPYVLRLKVKPQPIKNIIIRNNPLKMGVPLFERADTEMPEGSAGYYTAHTVDADDPYPLKIRDRIDSLFSLLYHTEEELKVVLPPEFPADSYMGIPAGKVEFTGCFEAEILNNVFTDNLYDIHSKIDGEYGFHASSPYADCWGRYDGFGTWIENLHGFYGKVYSRDGGRAVMSLIDTGFAGTGRNIIAYLNEKLMFFKQKGLTIGGQPIPGHWTVIVNEPLIYSETLTEAGWPTRYTKVRFGKEYKNLGNLETDGHGLTMMSTYKAYLSLKRDPGYVCKNWEYIKEAADFIVWCMDYPDLTFTEDDVLYGETEAAMNDYTLYANLPCCLGLLLYSEMAKAAGYTEEAQKWLKYHKRLYNGMERRFVKRVNGKECWDLAHCGFYHDPVLTILSDIYGSDISVFPYPKWVERSQNTYIADIAQYAKDTFSSPRGLGYDFNMIAQNALLLDKIPDYTELIKNIAKACYSPKFKYRYIVPEGATVLTERRVYRRQGDIGNLVQQAETFKTIMMMAGIYESPDGTIRITPRPFSGGGIKCDIRVINSANAKASLKMAQLDKGIQRAEIKIDGAESEQKVIYRAGPFDTACVDVIIDNKPAICEVKRSGDGYFAYADITGEVKNRSVTLVFTPSSNVTVMK